MRQFGKTNSFIIDIYNHINIHSECDVFTKKPDELKSSFERITGFTLNLKNRGTDTYIATLKKQQHGN